MTTASSSSMWPYCCMVLGNTMTSMDRSQVLEDEDGHEVALLGPLLLEGGDHAADDPDGAVGRVARARRWCTSVLRRSDASAPMSGWSVT